MRIRGSPSGEEKGWTGTTWDRRDLVATSQDEVE